MGLQSENLPPLDYLESLQILNLFEKHLHQVAFSTAQKIGLLQKCRKIYDMILLWGIVFTLFFFLSWSAYCATVWLLGADCHLKLLDRIYIQSSSVFIPWLAFVLSTIAWLAHCLYVKFFIVLPIHFKSIPPPPLQATHVTSHATSLNGMTFNVLIAIRTSRVFCVSFLPFQDFGICCLVTPSLCWFIKIV